MTQPGVTEFKDTDNLSATELPLREHAAGSRAKKVVPGPRWFAPDPASATRTATPAAVTTSGTSQAIAMAPRTAYRFIASTAICFKLSKGAAVAATVADIYLPANTEMILRSGDEWSHINVILATGSSAGLAQIAQVQ